MNNTNFYPDSGMFHASLPLIMGTRLDVLLFGDNKEFLENVWEHLEEELWRLDKMLNRFDPESEVAGVNNNAHLSDVQLSDELWEIMLDCRRYYKKTDGYFDVTCTDFDQLLWLDQTQGILFDKSGMMLDFGGYAKGYALKSVRSLLEEAGIERALVNFGNSSALAIGSHPLSDSWTIQIDCPTSGNEPSLIRLSNSSLSVSGNTPERNGHIFNPKTAEPVQGDSMVAVVADDPLDAEVLTTAWVASGSHTDQYWMSKFKVKASYRIQ